MMPRYYFQLHQCGTYIPDDEGVDLPDVEAARLRGLHEARHLMASEVAEGRLCVSCRIDEDEDRQPVLILPFREALQISG